MEPSNRWRKAKARADNVNTRVANLRREGAHQLTTRLAREFDTVVVEDLAVTNMVRNRTLARAISDAGWGEIRRQLDYKTRWGGGLLVVADWFCPSSKTCSACGAVRAKLLLSERSYVCAVCGTVIDRDLNAALNLVAWAAAHDTGESRREQPEGTRVRRERARAVGPPREGPRAQPRLREKTGQQT